MAEKPGLEEIQEAVTRATRATEQLTDAKIWEKSPKNQKYEDALNAVTESLGKIDFILSRIRAGLREP